MLLATLDTPLATYFSGWERYQQSLAAAIAPLDDQQLGLQAAPHLWSVRMIASHIVAVRAWWFHAWMGEGGPELDRLVAFDEGERSHQRLAAEIVRGLEVTWSLVGSCLGRWTAADLNARFRRPRPDATGQRPWRDRRYIVWHVAEHDMHHGGELSLSLGMNGLSGIDI